MNTDTHSAAAARLALRLSTILLLLACCAAAPATGPATQGDVLAQGSHDLLWIAQMTPGDARQGTPPVTVIRKRPVQSGQWKEIARFDSPLIALAEQGDTLIAVQQGGQWLRLGEGQFSNGAPLPGDGAILAMAGSADSLWAIGLGQPPASRPASDVAAHPASGPTTRPAASARAAPSTLSALPPPRPLLFLFNGGRWQAVSGISVLRTSDPREVSMGITAEGVEVAFAEGEAIHILRFNAAKLSWTTTGTVRAGFGVRVLKLLPTPSGQALWAAGDTGPGALFIPGAHGEWSPPRPVESPNPSPIITARTAAVAGDEIRVIIATPGKNGPQLEEQKYRFDGALTQRFAPLPWPSATAGAASPVALWVNLGIMAVLLVLMFTSIRRRRAAGPITVDLEKLALAPLGLRLLAGVIDLLPILIQQFIYVYRHAPIGDTSVMLNDPHYLIWTAIADGIYIAHTLLAEVFAGRSIGKMIVGLNVVSIDGSRPRAWSMVLRNLLRFVDIQFFMAPLLLILWSPLRQRVGDAAAGTVVVLKRRVLSEG